MDDAISSSKLKMENLFPGDSYDTPESAPRSIIDRLLFNSRFYFLQKNFRIFQRTGTCARKGGLDVGHQVYFSNMNIRLVELCGGKIHLKGLNNLNSNGPFVLIGNHMSSLETALFHAIARPRIDFTFVIKRSLFSVPYFGDIMRALKAIPVDRENPRDDFKTIMHEGKALLESGRSLILFPQATRNEKFMPEHFNSIGVKLARAANVKIIPFALKTDFLGNGSIFRDLGPIRRDRHIHFEFGAPIAVEGNGKAEHQQIIDFIQLRLKQWGHQG
ncbi:MAG: lysophospholipid acyltransferase family protein [Victivallaceae bacterium]